MAYGTGTFKKVDKIVGPGNKYVTAAKMFSGLSVDDFVKKPTFQYLSKGGLAQLADAVITLAEEEGLPMHAQTIRERIGGVTDCVSAASVKGGAAGANADAVTPKLDGCIRWLGKRSASGAFGGPTPEDVDRPAQGFSAPPQVHRLGLLHALDELMQIRIIWMRSNILGRRIPLKAFVSVPVICVAHESVNEVESSLLPHLDIRGVSAEPFQLIPGGLEIALRRFLPPIGLARYHPTTRLDHADQRVQSASVSTEDPTSTDTRRKTEAVWFLRFEVSTVRFNQGDIPARHSRLQSLLRGSDEERRDIDAQATHTIGLSQANQELALPAGDVNHAGIRLETQQLDEPR